MSEPVNITSLKTIFSFPFKGKGWGTRFFIGIVIIFVGFIIPIIPLIFVGGYLLEVMRRAARGEELVLPEWHEWGKLFVDGLKSALIGLILLLPGTIVIIAGWTFYMSSIFSIALISSAANNSGRDAGAVIVPVIMTAMSVFFISLFVGPILIALGAIPLPVAAANMAAEGKLAGAFRIRKWWPALWHNKLGYFIAFTIFLGLASVVYFATTLVYITFVCCWLIPFMSVFFGYYLALVYAALFGDTYRQSMEPAPESLPVEGEPGPTEPESAEAAAPVEEAPAPEAEEPPAVQPPEAAEPPAPESPQVQDPDLTVIHNKKTPPAPETPA